MKPSCSKAAAVKFFVKGNGAPATVIDVTQRASQTLNTVKLVMAKLSPTSMGHLGGIVDNEHR